MGIHRYQILFAFLTLALLGCGEKSREYEVRENTREAVATKQYDPHKGHDHGYGGGDDGHKEHVHHPYDFDLPSSWQEKKSSGMRLLSFTDATGGLDGSLVVLGKEASDLTSNINRWRGQVGLEELSKEECLKLLGEGRSKVSDFKSLHLKGPDGKGILAAIYVLGNKVIFAKMMGASSLTEKEEGNFLAFCTSLRPHTH